MDAPRRPTIKEVHLALERLADAGVYYEIADNLPPGQRVTLTPERLYFDPNLPFDSMGSHVLRALGEVATNTPPTTRTRRRGRLRLRLLHGGDATSVEATA